MNEDFAPTLVGAWNAARAQLEAARVDSPVIDARLLLEAATGASRTDIITDPRRPITPEMAATLNSYVERRARREPVSRILGRKGFWKIALQVTSDVLTPRPDTEVIVDLALKAFPEGRAFTMADLGVGSGAILLSVLAERPAARGLGTDVSLEALAVARENAANLDLNNRAVLLRTSWADGLEDGGYDLVVSNPPYIPSADIAGLEPEVRDHEPRLALDGGPDGLDAYRLLAPEVMRLLRPGGLFAVEIGHDQARAVRPLFEQAGAHGVQVVRDLGDRDRVVTGEKPR
ncbi:MAG: peptide chain release factor N(5)-glutamine methyltransferase [Proteobacteria bacterium]|nr:peptide chain release factor N(5)-glutamine methyltransferase [Pseudomonadota bacterium]